MSPRRAGRGVRRRIRRCWTCATPTRWRPGSRRPGGSISWWRTPASRRAPAPADRKAAAQARAIFATNLDGVLNTVLPAMELMARQPPGVDGLRGRIAVVASIAAFVAAPGAPAYCASKAAVDAWAVATAPAARARGIALTSVCPGYVRTPMTASNRFPMPGLMDADRAAAPRAGRDRRRAAARGVPLVDRRRRPPGRVAARRMVGPAAWLASRQGCRPALS